MNQSPILSVLILTLMVGCVAPSHPKARNGAVLIEQGPGEIELRFWKRSWGGIFGVHGYVGYVTHSYAAALEGSGPIFTNPRFQDNPGFHCLGTIVLDREHNQVTINMRRIVSMQGEPERAKPHPANGTYTIESVRKAKADEMQWYKSWQQDRMK